MRSVKKGKEQMYRKMVHIADKFRYCWYVLCLLAAYVTAPLVRNSKKYRNLWLIAERGTDAQDNGYHFYKYMRREHPEINARYLICVDSPDRERFEEKDRLISYRSFEHYLAFVLAEYKISTHIMGFAPDMWFFTKLDRYGIVRGKTVCLQHGIIKDDIQWMHRSNVRLDLFVCGAKKEAEAVTATYGHPKGVVRYLGLCRYDALPCGENYEKSGIVLFMPTWRLYLKDISDAEFRKSDFFYGIQNMLSDNSIGKILKTYGYRLLFCPHTEVHPYLHNFTYRTDECLVPETGECDVQSLLIQADVLITDYSSIFFDFAYMEKPVIYYQFDQETFRYRHYREGYFNYEKDGFGPVTTCCEALAAALDSVLKNGGKMDARYKERLNVYFVYHDRKNCERNFEAIKELGRGDRQNEGKN